jgi:hypothetical protein
MRFADNSVPAYVTELVGDLACGFSIVPKFLELLDAVVSPDHLFAPLPCSARFYLAGTPNAAVRLDNVVPCTGRHNISTLTPPQAVASILFMMGLCRVVNRVDKTF